MSKNTPDSLKKYLETNTCALVNWALRISKQGLKKQIRVGSLFYQAQENDPYSSFIKSHLIVEKGSFLINLELLDLLNDFLKENGFPSLSVMSRRRAPAFILDNLTHIFKVSVRPARQKNFYKKLAI